MTVTNMWSGAVTSSGARVNAKITGTSARLAVADNSAMSSPTFFGPVSPAMNIVKLTATGLAQNTQYWYRIEDTGVVDTTKTGKFRTHKPVGTPFSFGFCASACAGLDPAYPGTSGLVPTRISNHPVFDEIRAPNPLFFAHMGDLHYYNLGSGSFGIGGGTFANYRSAYDDVLAQSRQAQLYREVPIVYNWDDHCFGPNDSDGTYATKATAAAVYRERVPSYPLVEASGAIYHTFQVGRVQYVVLDGRYERDAPTDPAPRTYLGSAQLAWLENLLQTSDAAFLIVQMAQPIMSNGTTSWGGSYDEERQDLYAMFGDTGWVGRMFGIAGDQHQFGWDSGSHTAGFPFYTCAPLDSSFGIAGTAYDLGYYGESRGCFGYFRILDWGKTIGVRAWGLVADV